MPISDFTVMMYKSCPPVYYIEVSKMYMAKVSLLNGESFRIPFSFEGKRITPHSFVIDFLTKWIWGPKEIKLIEMFQDNIYQESYIPQTGWFKKGRDDMEG